MIYAIIFTLVSVSAWIWIDVALKVGREIHEASMKKKAIRALESSMSNSSYFETFQLSIDFKKEFKSKTRKSRKTKEQI